MANLKLLILSTIVGAIFAQSHRHPVRNTKSGQIRGNIREFYGKEVYVFEGIRYGMFHICFL